MHRLSGFLSIVALISATLAVCVSYFSMPPIGYEGRIFLSSVAVVLAIGAGLLSLALAAIIFARKKRPKPVKTTAISIVSIAIAVGYVWTM